MKCGLCGGPINLDDPENFSEVTGWVSGPKQDGMKLRDKTGRHAHKYCVEKLEAGQAPDQPELDLD